MSIMSFTLSSPRPIVDGSVCSLFDGYLTRTSEEGPRYRPRPVRSDAGLSDEESLDLGRSVVETVATKAVVENGPRLRDGHEPSGPEQRQVMLDRRFRELELLGDLGQVEVSRREQLQDPESRLVAERAVEADDREGRRQLAGRVQRQVGDGIAEEPPVVRRHQEVVRP